MKAQKFTSMLPFAIAVVAATTAGCASTSGWRQLTIDGSSEAKLDASLSLLKAELPYARREMLELALADVRLTESRNAELRAATYTDDDFRRQLDGMTYEGVMDLADRAGPSIRTVYYSRRRQRDPWDGRSWSGTNPDRFPSYVQPPPGVMGSQ